MIGRCMIIACLVVGFFWGGGPRHVACGCGILVPQPGIEPGPLAVRTWSPSHWTAREFPRGAFSSDSLGQRNFL